MKQRLRPYRSVSLPPGIISAAMTSRKMVIATCTPWTVVSRSWLMSLIMTFMFEPAKLQMNCASASGNEHLPAGCTCRVLRSRHAAIRPVRSDAPAGAGRGLELPLTAPRLP